MPTLAEWPKILASAAEAVLSVPELGYTIPVHDHSPAAIPSLPCIMVEWGDAGVLLDPPGSGELSTLCQDTWRFTVRLAVGDPGSPDAAFIVLDAVQRLHAGLADAIAADPDAGGYRPPATGIASPTPDEYAAVPIWSARFPIIVPVSKIPPTTP